MMMATETLFDRYYYSNPAFEDGTTIFHRLCRQSIPAGGQALELGAGPRNKTSDFLSRFVELHGVDTSSEIHDNPALKQAHVYDGLRLPFADSSFDACVSNYVLEHVEDPAQHLREVARVLREGGVYCFRTPNLWHYVTLGSRLLPHCFHLRWANWLRNLTGAHDPYPTHYRLNTAGSIARHARSAGLCVSSLRYVEAEPYYGRRHSLLFYPMLAYERMVNSTELLAPLRTSLVALLTKPF
jgi:SAM-dependent methyltransferase